MSKTNRVYLDRMCLKANAMEHRQKQQKSIVDDLNKEEKLTINHRKDLPETYDDRCIAALSENKYIWKNGIEIKAEDGFYNVFFQNNFVVNLTKEELAKFPWTKILPIEKPPSLSKFNLT